MNRINGRVTGNPTELGVDFEPSCLVRTPSGNVYIPSGNISKCTLHTHKHPQHPSILLLLLCLFLSCIVLFFCSMFCPHRNIIHEIFPEIGCRSSARLRHNSRYACTEYMQHRAHHTLLTLIGALHCFVCQRSACANSAESLRWETNLESIEYHGPNQCEQNSELYAAYSMQAWERQHIAHSASNCSWISIEIELTTTFLSQHLAVAA